LEEKLKHKARAGHSDGTTTIPPGWGLFIPAVIMPQ
jgi:hypothetical protein